MVRFSSSWRLPALFFLLTVLSTLYVGSLHGLNYWSPELLVEEASWIEALRRMLVYGAPFSFTLLAIILSHEMGHYWAARYYRVDATLPFFLPFPFSLVGTFGAFIIIKSRFPHRKSLIDIGLAGPFAGFIVVIPALIAGVRLSRVIPFEPGWTLGTPLLFNWIASSMGPVVPEGYGLYVSPIGLAGWFGLLLTALNLLPIGQLDGGHASYALLRTGAHRLSAWALFAFLPMTYFGPSWLFWALLLYVLGIRRPHPSTRIDETPPPRSRYVMGALALAVLIVCFTPEPIIFNWADAWAAFKELLGI